MGDSIWFSNKLQQQVFWDALGTEQETENPTVQYFTLRCLDQ